MSIIALDVLNKILGYVLGLSISFKIVGSDICCSFFFSGRFKYDLIRFFQLVFCFLCKFWIGEHAQFAIMIFCTDFPITIHTMPQTQFAIRGQLEKVTVPLKILYLCYSMTDLKKEKFLLKLFIPSFAI